MTTVDELMESIFGEQRPFFAAELESWIKASRRFRAFAETYATKISKKLRTAQDEEGLRSLYAELETAYRLLQDSRFEVKYEKLGVGKTRTPDFTLTFRVNVTLNVEVTRLRFSEGQAIPPKLMKTVCDKVGQMQPGTSNVLVLFSDGHFGKDDIQAAMKQLREMAERKQDDFFTRRGFTDTRDFLRYLQQLSAVICRNSPSNTGFIWLNSAAKRPLPGAIHQALLKLFEA